MYYFCGANSTPRELPCLINVNNWSSISLNLGLTPKCNLHLFFGSEQVSKLSVF